MADWFDDNAPPNTTSPATSPDNSAAAAQITAWYQQYLHRTPSAAEIQTHLGNPGGLSAVQKVIQAAAGTSAEPGTTTAGAKPTGGNLKDPTYARSLVDYFANQPGANPSLKNDPTYWVGRMTQVGGDQGYWESRFMQPEGAPEGSNGGGTGNAPDPNQTLPVTPYGGINSTPSPYVAPTWTGGSAPTGPTLTGYTAPTEAELEVSPGYQSRLAAGLQARNRSAAAQGSVLSGGIQQELAQYGQDYASNEYSNLVGQKMAGVQLNNNVAQTGFGNAFQTYMANYGQFSDAAARGLGAYTTNVATQRNAGNDYWSKLNDLYQTGAGLAGSSYKPSNVP